MKRMFFVAMMMLGFAMTAQAESRYIVDQASIPLRAGQSTAHKILKMLPSGMKVELLEQSTDGYSLIRAPGGKEGWILSRYLMKTPAARDRLIQAEAELVKLNDIKKQLGDTEKELSKVTRANKQLSSELELIRKTAADAVRITEENKRLKSDAEAAKAAYEKLEQETREIRNGSQQRWFMLGGGAILLGITLGLILPTVRYRRKDRWGRY